MIQIDIVLVTQIRYAIIRYDGKGAEKIVYGKRGVLLPGDLADVPLPVDTERRDSSGQLGGEDAYR